MSNEALLRWEGRLIVEASRLATVQAKIMKQLERGVVESELRGSYMDLRNIATQIEQLTKEIPSATG